MTLLTERDVHDFRRELNAEVVDGARDDAGGGDFKENVFTRIVIDCLTEAGVAEGGEVCYLDKQLPAPYGTIKCNGYYVPDDAERVDIFYTIYDGDSHVEPLTTKEIEDALKRAIRIVDLGRKNAFRELEESNDAWDMLACIHEHAPSIQRLRLFLVTDRSLSERTKKAVERHVKGKGVTAGISLRLEIIDVARLWRIAKSGDHDPIEIDLSEDFLDYKGGPLACVKAPPANPMYDVYLTVLPGSVLAELYDEYGSRLLELNVRAYLQLGGQVNRGMRKTLMTEQSMFLPYNNGISATADAVETAKAPDGSMVLTKITGLQIVNGGQTMASIHRAKKIDGVNISDVYVQAKVTTIRSMDQVDLDDLVKKISLYANTQNQVNKADFSANDPLHVRLELLANAIYVPGEQSRWFYERARGAYQTARNKFAGTSDAKRKEFERMLPPSQKFTKTDFAKYSGTWDQIPQSVSQGGQKHFVAYMDLLEEEHGKKWIPDEDYYRRLVAKAILFRRLERVVRQEEFPAYRANVVTYTLALIASRAASRLDLDRIWMQQSVSDELADTMRATSHRVFDAIRTSAGDRNVTEWCKKDGCWEAVGALEVTLPPSLPEMSEVPLRYHDLVVEPAAPAKKRPRKEPAPTDATAIMATIELMDVASGTWQEIARWGAATEKLTSAQINLVSRLRDLSANGWEKTPTRAQVKRAGYVIDQVKAEFGSLDAVEVADTDWK